MREARSSGGPRPPLPARPEAGVRRADRRIGTAASAKASRDLRPRQAEHLGLFGGTRPDVPAAEKVGGRDGRGGSGGLFVHLNAAAPLARNCSYFLRSIQRLGGGHRPASSRP